MPHSDKLKISFLDKNLVKHLRSARVVGTYKIFIFFLFPFFSSVLELHVLTKFIRLLAHWLSNDVSC